MRLCYSIGYAMICFVVFRCLCGVFCVVSLRVVQLRAYASLRFAPPPLRLLLLPRTLRICDCVACLCLLCKFMYHCAMFGCVAECVSIAPMLMAFRVVCRCDMMFVLFIFDVFGVYLRCTVPIRCIPRLVDGARSCCFWFCVVR